MKNMQNADDVIDKIYKEIPGVKFAFVFITSIDLNQSWCIKGHPFVEHRTGFGNILRNIADRLDKMYKEKYLRKRG